ncbi:glucose 1-dehydrogenase [Paenibacillus sp. JX-17]|uniref:Glucose 1-dehydrogenase n=1 Tax=Paenibacillus lacisoli TaxID=3064525 RepID=A0ABT9C924_9BACL|nr:glucose 1-dehydrogenase [Paenibacillus sp. JX-17]MDO7905752.1 glucose 1-dehydrogenase [Paenibacillus sp. JX-17]
MRLQNKASIITGAGGGLGRAAAIKFVQEGAKLILVDLNGEALEQTVQAVKKFKPDAEVYTITADVTDEADVQKYVQLALDKFGRIDALFNNAGIEGPVTPLGDYDSAAFSKVIDINLKGIFLGLKHVINVMKEQKSGAIINTASSGGVIAAENFGAYVASKHGVVGLTRNAAVEYSKYGIHINAICPGPINTDMIKHASVKWFPENPQQYYDQITAGIPAGRLGEPEEVANLVAFLASDESAYVNGTAISIDGAMTIQ